jgi:UDPglucose--hexose-1-phosphate uridylyltransferase
MSKILEPSLHPHRRYNPLTDEWLLVSPQRTSRPWQGQRESASGDQRGRYDAKCYLCPGNLRAGGQANPGYDQTFVFINDYSSVLPEAVTGAAAVHELVRCEPVSGTCRVICFSPRHDLTLAEMKVEEIARVVEVWEEQTRELGAQYSWIQVFENKGAVMGCSNPHPHGQIWATDVIPTLPAREDECQRQYFARHDRPLLLDYLDLELARGERIVAKNDGWVALVPYWATWPFETMVLPRKHRTRLLELGREDGLALASLLKGLLVRYDNLFETAFPYSMGWHGAPFVEGDSSHWMLHAHYFPPLLRSATVKKFMVGYEMLAEPQRDITPEAAAQRLREVLAVHYRQRSQP